MLKILGQIIKRTYNRNTMFYKIHGVRVLVYHNNKLLILKRADSDKSDANLWDIPGGKIESGESVHNAIKRELFEETGLLGTASASIKNLYGSVNKHGI